MSLLLVWGACVPTTCVRACVPTTCVGACVPTTCVGACVPTTCVRACVPNYLWGACVPTTCVGACVPTTCVGHVMVSLHIVIRRDCAWCCVSVTVSLPHPTPQEAVSSSNTYNLSRVSFGRYEIGTWYTSPYPSVYTQMNKLYICEFCLKYFRTSETLSKHMVCVVGCVWLGVCVVGCECVWVCVGVCVCVGGWVSFKMHV